MIILPYCAKCGIEVDYDVRKCPICQFRIPEIEAEEEIDTDRFPKAENVYPKEQRELRDTIFIIISTIALTSCILMVFQNKAFSGELTWSRYSIVSVIATWGYLFIFFGYIPRFNYIVLGLSVNTLVLLLCIDSFSGDIEWFFSISAPIVLLAFTITHIIGYLYRKSHKKGLNIAAYIMIGIALFLIGIEVSLDIYFRGTIDLVWSIIVAIQLVPIALLLLYLNYRLPKKYKEKLKKKFHL